MRYARYASHSDSNGDTGIDNHTGSIPREVAIGARQWRLEALNRCDDRYKVRVERRSCKPPRNQHAARRYMPKRLSSVSETQVKMIIATVKVR